MMTVRPHVTLFHEQCISSVTFRSAQLSTVNIYMRVGVAQALANLSDFGLLGSKVPQNGRFPALDADEPPCKI